MSIGFDAKKIDAALIISPINRYYFTNFHSSNGFVLISENAKYFYTDSRYYLAAQNLDGFTVRQINGENVYKTIIEDLKKLNAGTVGYEDDFLTVSAFKEFKKELNEFSLKPISNEIANARLIKTETEIEKISAAQKIAEKAFEAVINKFLKTGITEKELKNELIFKCLELGADKMAFDPIVAFGANSAIPHHQSGDKKLEKTDIVLIDFGIRLDGYNSDMTRTFCLAEPDDEKLSRMYEIVLNAQTYVLKHLKAGMTAGEVDSMAREYIKANGYDSEFCHSLGHGVGLQIHEQPLIKAGSETLLLPNMVVTIEPGIYVEGLGGVRIEDMVVIQENGIKNLTNTKKEFII